MSEVAGCEPCTQAYIMKLSEHDINMLRFDAEAHIRDCEDGIKENHAHIVKNLYAHHMAFWKRILDAIGREGAGERAEGEPGKGSVTVDKALLKTMLAEYWDVDNNETCAGATILFLRKAGFTPREISNAIEDDFGVTQDRLNEIEDEVKEQMAYYQEE